MTVLSQARVTMSSVARARFQIPLLGRADELEQLCSAISRARDGDPSTVLLAGDAGVGKTRLLRELREWAAGEDLMVAVGHCVDLGEVGLPYLPFTEILSGLRHDSDSNPDVADVLTKHPGVVSLLGDPTAEQLDLPDRVGPASAGSGQRQLFDAVAAMLFDLSGVQPLLLVVEDLHWADQSTRDLLRFLISRLTDQWLTIIASYRTDDLHRRHPLRPWLAELARVDVVDRLTLAPLADRDVAALVRAVRPDELTDVVLRRIVERAEGNAFYAEELSTAEWSGAVPVALGDVLLARLEALPTDAQHVVRVAAIAGRSVGHDVLASVAGLEPAALDAAIREAVNWHILIADDDGRYQFRHALLRESAYGDLLPGERVRLHAAFAKELADTGSAAELALHYRESNDLAGALQASWQAARDAARLRGPVEQLQHLERILGLWSKVPDAEERVGRPLVVVALEASAAAAAAGELSRSIKLASLALEQLDDASAPVLDPNLRARVHFTLGQYLLNFDQDAEGYTHTKAAMETLGPEANADNATIWAWAAAIHMRAAYFTDRFDEAATAGAAGVRVAEQFAVDDARADLMITTARLQERLPEGAVSLGQLTSALELARSSGDVSTEFRATYNLAVAAFDRGDLTGALDLLENGTQRAVDIGLPYGAYATEMLYLTAYLRFITGDWDAVVRIADACRQSGPEATRQIVAGGLLVDVARGNDVAAAVTEVRRWAEAPLIAIILGLVGVELAIREADSGQGRRAVLDVSERVDPKWGSTFMARIRLIALLISVYADDVDRFRLVRDEPRIAATLAEAAPFLDDGAEVIRRCRVERGSESLGLEADAWVSRLAAESSRLNGSSDLAAWEATVEAFGYGDRYEQARSRLRLAEALMADDRRAEAQAQAQLVYGVARELGAATLRDAVEALARRGRLDIGAPSSARLDGTTLTPREQEVLTLLSLGRTNRQIGSELFISEKTASVHVSNILGKLRASGRTEAVTIAHQRGLISA